jgi:hypothetical protein
VKHEPPTLEEMNEKTILSLTDLKRFLGKILGGCFAAFLLAGQYFYTQLAANGAADAKRDMAIQGLQDEFRHTSETGKRLEKAIDDQRLVSSQMLLEMTKLAGKAASTEEIARSTQSRIEALTDYLRNDRIDQKKTVLDSMPSRRTQGYVEP